VALTAANRTPAAAASGQLIAAPFGCWKEATSTPWTAPAMADGAARPEFAALVPPAGLASWRSNCGECVALTLERSAGRPSRRAAQPPGGALLPRPTTRLMAAARMTAPSK